MIKLALQQFFLNQDSDKTYFSGLHGLPLFVGIAPAFIFYSLIIQDPLHVARFYKI